VDKIGGLDDAIAKAASLAKIKITVLKIIQNMRKILMTFWLISILQNLKLIS
jgi:ClpP class serine protease